MKKNYLLFFLLLILSNSYSQCPSGQFGITNPSFEGPIGAHITPSPWNTCAITPDTQPGFWGITLAPSDGSSYVGLVNGGPGWLEGVSQTLSNSLLAGFTYNLTIDLAMGNSNQGGIQPAPTRIKIYGGNAVCQKTQLLWTSPTISHATWQKYNIILAPNQNFTSIYIVIDDTSPLNSYMLIDNIRQLPTSVASVVSNITCNGGKGGINLTTSGGMQPYIFNWNDGVTTEDRTGLAAGAYTVTVTDSNGCISTKSFTITEPTALNSVPTQVNVLCNGNATGSATAVISGGVAPYTYVWNNGITSTTNQATNLVAGTYEVTVTDANGCIIKQNFTITQPDILNINLQETSFNICSACNDSNLVATITGGTAPYTYSWNDGVITKDRSDLLNGTYTLTVTDAKGCTVSKNIVVSTKVELPYRDFTYTNGNAESELNNFTTCQSAAVVKASSGRYTNGVWYDGSYELFVNNTSLGVFTGEKIIDISSYIPITSVRAVGNHNFWSWTAIEVKTYSDVVDVPPTSPIVSTIYYELNNTAVPLTATLNGVGTTLKWYTDELGSDYSATAPMPLTNQLGTTSYYVSQANSVGCESARAKIDVIVVSPISYTPQINNLLCFTSTGSIDLSVSGGTGSYTYLWSNGATTEDITVSQGGNYTCTITDQNSGLSITTQVLQVLQPLPLQAAIVTIDVACFGENNGEAIVTATDGTAPYTYVWNNGITSTTNEATNLAAGTYEVTVTDANGCIIKQSFTITEPSALNSVPSQVNVLCHGNATGSATAVISGGLAPYTYVWNNGIASTTNEATNLSAGTYEVTATDANGCIIKQSFTITEPSALNSVPSQVNVLCHGNATGSATAVISGGLAPYTYVWNNGITSTTNEATNLVAGTYEVTVTDANGCIIKQSFTIIEPTALNSVPSQVDVLCHGESTGSATAVISGGVAPYTYVWNNGIASTTNEATNLAAGTYEVTVTDANGCIIKQSFTITEPSALNSVPSQVNVLCHGNATGSATTVISGGVAPYTYVWNSGITSTTNEATNLAVGTYEVTVTDANGCIIKQSFTITEPTALNSAPSQVDVLCHGESTGSATAVISGGIAPYTYVWNNGITSTTNEATNLAAGTYEVTATDANGCIIKQSFTITESTALNSAPSQVDILCHGESTGSATAVISGGVAPYTYVWNNGITSTTNETTNLSAGTYEVTATDANGCIIKQSFTITQPSALQSVPSQVNVLCHGNTTGSATAVISGGLAPYTYVWNNGITSTTNEATNLAAGTYEVTVTDANGCIIKQSFTITEPTVLNSIPSQVNVLCHGNATGSATAVISGGVAPYTYVWNNGITSTTNEATNLAAGTYEVTVTDANGCIIKQSFTIIEPTALQSVPSQVNVLCHGESTGSATAVISGGVAPYTYVWNNGINSTTNEATNLVAGTYEITVTDSNGCIIKQSFTITEPPLVLAPLSHNQEFCIDDNPTVSDLLVTGTLVKWYSSLVSSTPLQESDLLTSGTYFATQTVNGCESPDRTAVDVTVYDLDMVDSSSVTICLGTSVGQIILENFSAQQLKWYINSNDINEISSNYVIGSGTYYVSNFNGICESPRTPIYVDVIQNLPMPAAATHSFCENSYVSQLVATGAIEGAEYVWYANASTNIPLQLGAPLQNGTYFVTQKILNCESARRAVTVKVTLLTAPQTTSFQLCENATVADLVMPTPSGVTYNWYFPNQIIPLSQTTTLVSGNYFVSKSQNGCESTKTIVQVTINPRPNSPTGISPQNFIDNGVMSNVIMDQPNIVWYVTYEDALNNNNPLENNRPLENDHVYYAAIIDHNGCSSLPTPITVTITLGIKDLDLAALKYYPNPTDSEINISYKEAIRTIEVYDLLGKLIKVEKFNSNDIKMNVSNLSSGTYVFRIKTESGSQFVKIIKE